MSEPLNERDIRPTDLLARYLELAERDAVTFFADAPRHKCLCPACDHPGDHEFTKLGFDYRQCPTCHTLWVSPRPDFAAFAAFYSQSESSKYWAEVFTPAVAEARRIKLWRPKAARIAELAAKWGDSAKPFRTLVDIGGGTGVFAEEFTVISQVKALVIEPSPEAARAARERGLEVIEGFLENITLEQLPSGPTIFTSFELFEHVYAPRDWLSAVTNLMRPEDLLVLTTLSGTGLDIRVLWDKSVAVNPPHHINFLNPNSISRLAESIGLQPLEVITPGQLDFDILRNNKELIEDRFLRLLLDSASVEELSAWQDLLASSRRSSHMWAVLKRQATKSH